MRRLVLASILLSLVTSCSNGCSQKVSNTVSPATPVENVAATARIEPIPGLDLTPVELVSINKEMYGINVSTSIKALHVAWDSKTSRMFVCGTMGHSITVVDPAVGKPISAIDLEVPPEQSMACDMRIDEKSRRLYWMTRTSGIVRVIDVDQLKIVAKHDPTEGRGQVRYRYSRMAVDNKSGWLWFADDEQKKLVGNSPDLKQQVVVPNINHVVAMSSDPRGDVLYLVDSHAKDEGTLYRYVPSTNQLTSLKTFTGGNMPLEMEVGGDGSIYLARGKILTALNPDLTEKWSAPLGHSADRLAVTDSMVAVLTSPRSETREGGTSAGKGGKGGGGKGMREGAPPVGSKPKLSPEEKAQRKQAKRSGAPMGDATGEAPVAGGAPARRGPPEGRGPGTGAGRDSQGAHRQPITGSEMQARMGATGMENSQFQPEDLVIFVDIATGAKKGEALVGYESKGMAVDPAGHLLVGNGGAGSVSIIDTQTLSVNTIDVGNTAEGLAVDTQTGNRYIVSRLGGSTIYKWSPDGKLTAFSGGQWPVEVLTDVAARRLYAISHYESAVYQWNLDDGTSLPKILFGVPVGMSDTLPDMDIDTKARVAVGVFPESGYISVVDLNTGAVRWTKNVASLKAGFSAGPGNAYIQVDSANDRVYVMGGKPREIRAYVLSTGADAGEALLNAQSRGTFKINSFFYDRVGQRLFAGTEVFSANSLQALQQAVPADKIFYSDEKRLLGSKLGTDNKEYVVDIDPKTLAVRDTWAVHLPSQVRSEYTFEPTSGKLYLSQLTTATVMAFQPPLK